MWIIYDTRDVDEQSERGKDSDLWLIASPDKTAWRDPQRLVTLNSVAHDFDPVLFQDGHQRLVLAFASDRRGENELWLAMSNDGNRWQRPRRIDIRDEDGAQLRNLISPALFQDSRGIYRLAAFHTTTQRVLISSSKDLLRWEEARFVEIADIYPERGWGEKATLDYLEDNAGLYRLIVSGNYFYNSGTYLGSSKNARDWRIEKAEFVGDSHPSVIQTKDGRFAMMLSTAIDTSMSEYPIRYAFQFASKDWETWDEPVHLPRIHYLADYHMKPSTIYQDRDGSFWIANHRHYGEQFQLHRLSKFPATTIPETFPPKSLLHPHAKAQLRREELTLNARRNGDVELARCLRTARHYHTCLDGPSKQAEKAWWQIW